MLPNLLRLLITDNKLSNQASLENLFSVPRLKGSSIQSFHGWFLSILCLELSIMGNPVASMPNVKEQVTTFVPSLYVNFQKVQSQLIILHRISFDVQQIEEEKSKCHPLREKRYEEPKLSVDSEGIVVEDLGGDDSILTKGSKTSKEVSDNFDGIDVDKKTITGDVSMQPKYVDSLT